MTSPRGGDGPPAVSDVVLSSTAPTRREEEEDQIGGRLTSTCGDGGDGGSSGLNTPHTGHEWANWTSDALEGIRPDLSACGARDGVGAEAVELPLLPLGCTPSGGASSAVRPSSPYLEVPSGSGFVAVHAADVPVVPVDAGDPTVDQDSTEGDTSQSTDDGSESDEECAVAGSWIYISAVSICKECIW